VLQGCLQGKAVLACWVRLASAVLTCAAEQGCRVLLGHAVPVVVSSCIVEILCVDWGHWALRWGPLAGCDMFHYCGHIWADDLSCARQGAEVTDGLRQVVNYRGQAGQQSSLVLLQI
jgi:hypothetical protein